MHLIMSLSINLVVVSQDLPEEMEQLQHLRQFDISCNRLKNVPKAIQKMFAMQVGATLLCIVLGLVFIVMLPC
jgi:hypothetical protein